MNNDAEDVIMDTQLTRPYTATGGRTEATEELTQMTQVCSTRLFSPRQIEGEHAEALLLCVAPTSVAEVSVHLHLPVQTVRVLLSDLIKMGAVQAKAPATLDYQDLDATRVLLERLLEGLQRRL